MRTRGDSWPWMLGKSGQLAKTGKNGWFGESYNNACPFCLFAFGRKWEGGPGGPPFAGF